MAHLADQDGAAPRRCGYVAVIGAPNVGKSTLVNRLVGNKVSIVSPRSQTTRWCVRGIFVRGPAQVVLVDTPGLMSATCLLDRAMYSAAMRSLDDTDVALLLVDAAKSSTPSLEPAVRHLRTRQSTLCLVINKVDTVAKEQLLPLVAELTRAVPTFEQLFMISARSGDGVDALRDFLAARMPPGPWLYPPLQSTDLPDAVRAAEITREQIFLRLRDEVPRSTAVVPAEWREQADRALRIGQTIYVERDSQRPILIGEGGQRLRQIGQDARLKLQALFRRRTHLFLTVEVRRQWPQRDEALRWHNLGPPRGTR